ncbi:hypothetical protein DAPPUDRAFT_234676 [Daphnia pulex]|uniref:Uncharacterized protein n=1 Tax=Daphnia pulex TaxID=6669 RepID=E9FX51_DAPPU|nr:hypothetical protein DAPPUDRAFT_234676 [Daphnia pulex]|eukprot:EFX88323.1 hypothetical protein DAPPUDRAFT_234676 [Daphnia pulex]
MSSKSPGFEARAKAVIIAQYASFSCAGNLVLSSIVTSNIPVSSLGIPLHWKTTEVDRVTEVSFSPSLNVLVYAHQSATRQFFDQEGPAATPAPPL